MPTKHKRLRKTSSLKRSSVPEWVSLSCHPCCSAHAGEARGCGGPRGIGHYMMSLSAGHVLSTWGSGTMWAEVRPRFFSAARVAKMANAAVPASRTNVPDNLAVDSARDAVLQLEVHLGNRILGEHRGIRDITCEERSVSKIGCAGAVVVWRSEVCVVGPRDTYE